MRELKELLVQYGCPEEATALEERIQVCDFSFRHLEECFLKLGTILESNETAGIIIGTLRINFNHATVAAKYGKKEVVILSYAKEGVFKQNTAQKAIDIIKGNILPIDNSQPTQKPTAKKKLFIGITGTIILVMILLIANAFSACSTINQYNDAAEEFNSVVDEYNSAVTQTSVYNIEGIATSLNKINIENSSFPEGIAVLFGRNSISKIKSDTETIRQLTEWIIHSLNVLNQITAPKSEWVIQRLGNVEGITGTQTVTLENNPDGLLGKEGGYKDCIYFTVDTIDPKTIEGNDIVEKGTDAGGAVEIYGSLEEAEARCEYLAGFDGTVLYSGSYAIVGTMVIRTSYLLSNEEQFDFTDKITQALTI